MFPTASPCPEGLWGRYGAPRPFEAVRLPCGGDDYNLSHVGEALGITTSALPGSPSEGLIFNTGSSEALLPPSTPPHHGDPAGAARGCLCQPCPTPSTVVSTLSHRRRPKSVTNMQLGGCDSAMTQLCLLQPLVAATVSA